MKTATFKSHKACSKSSIEWSANWKNLVQRILNSHLNKCPNVAKVIIQGRLLQILLQLCL